MNTIYLISGLGADRRVFQNLDFGNYNVVHLDWIENQKNESLDHYISRLSEKIDKSKPHILCGVSFGGIVAQELSKITNPEKVIILSSIKYYKHIPINMRIAGLFLPLAPKGFLSKPNSLTKRKFGVEGESWELLKLILADQDDKFVRWCIKQLLKWKGDYRTNPCITQIHGNKDKMLRCVNPDFEIENGGHFMALDRAKEINKILKTLIE